MGIVRNFQQAIIMLSYSISGWNIQNLAKNNPKLVCFSYDYIGNYINHYGVYEGPELEKLCEVLKSNRTDICAIDVGANIGNHAIVFANIFGKVFAFEPDPTNFAVLKINTRNLPSIICYPLGASSQKEKLNFRMDALNSGNTRIVNSDELGEKGQFGDMLIDVVPIDDIDDIKKEKIGFIKIDTQGHEFDVIRGMNELLERDSPIICFEQEKNEIVGGTSETKKELESLGYGNYYAIENMFYSKNKIFIGKAAYIIEFLKILIFGSSRENVFFYEVGLLDTRQYNMLIASKTPIAH